jgi:acyl carrier protein
MTTFDKVKKIIIECTGVNGDLIKPEALFDEDIGLDSLDTIEIVMEPEMQFGCEIDDSTLAIIMSVQDAVNAVDMALGRKGGAA